MRIWLCTVCEFNLYDFLYFKILRDSIVPKCSISTFHGNFLPVQLSKYTYLYRHVYCILNTVKNPTSDVPSYNVLHLRHWHFGTNGGTNIFLRINYKYFFLQSLTHIHFHTRTCSHAHGRAHMCTRVHTCTLTCAHMHTHVHTHMCTHLHTCTCICAHTHTYINTHTHTKSLSLTNMYSLTKQWLILFVSEEKQY